MVTPLRIASAKAEIEMRELDHRTADGIEVTLLWNAKTNGVFVSVVEREGGMFEFQVPPGDALEAFHHPYAFAPDTLWSSALAA